MVLGIVIESQSDELVETYIVQMPMMVQLIARNISMTKEANIILNSLLQDDIYILCQLMSSGAGT